MGDSSSSAANYIRMVQHLIEECIIFRMSREECAEALSKHANITPAITSTVWKELEKENKEFFEAYSGRSMKEEEEDREEASSPEMPELNRSIQRLLLSATTSPPPPPTQQLHKT